MLLLLLLVVTLHTTPPPPLLGSGLLQVYKLEELKRRIVLPRGAYRSSGRNEPTTVAQSPSHSVSTLIYFPLKKL
jgi:hypothetical protein